MFAACVMPWQGQPVQVQVKTRRLRCRNRHCPRKIFAERLPGVAAPQARETNRLTQTLRRVGYVLGGLPGSSLLQQMGMIASRDTILRRVKTTSGRPQEEGKLRVLAVDDWAWRKQQRYGTILMDLERRRVVIMITSRLSRCHQTPGLVAANESFFKRARCISVMVRA